MPKGKGKAKAKAKPTADKVKKTKLKEKANSVAAEGSGTAKDTEGPSTAELEDAEDAAWKLKACLSMRSHVEILVCTSVEISLQESCRAALSACGFMSYIFLLTTGHGRQMS